MFLAVVASIVACGQPVPASGSNSLGEQSRTVLASPTTTASPAFNPSPNSIGGRVVRVAPTGVMVESEGRETAVDLALVLDVWKETSVPATALEVGDDLFVTGTAGSPFVARYVWANIDRINGVIREIDATGMVLEAHIRSGSTVLKRIDFSAYVEYGASDGSVKTTRADLVIGRSIGAVLYQPRSATARATRVW